MTFPMKNQPNTSLRGVPSPATPKPPTIPATLNDQGGLINELHEIIGTLECKCATILDPAPPTSAAELPCPPTPDMLGPLIRSHNGGIMKAINRLQCLRDRIQL